MAFEWPSSGRSPPKEGNNGRFHLKCALYEVKNTMFSIKVITNV